MNYKVWLTNFLQATDWLSFTRVSVKLVLSNAHKLKQRESEESNPQSSGEIPLGFYAVNK